jgi:predicted GNAT family acetyltransferase
MLRNRSPKEILEHLDWRWATKLGCEPPDLRKKSLRIVTDPTVKENCLHCFDKGGSLVLRVNPHSYELLALKVPQLGDHQGHQSISYNTVSYNTVVMTLKDVFTIRQGCSEAVYYRLNGLLDHYGSEVQTRSKDTVRRLEDNDETHLKRLQQACTERDLELGDVQIDHPLVYGCFVGEDLASVASVIHQDNRIADIGVLTHPKYRQKGLGRLVVSALSQASIEEDLIPQYWTLKENLASLKLVTSLGFEQYGTETVLRFS